MTAYSIAWKPLIHILHPPITQTLLLLSDDKTSLLVHRFEYVFTSFTLSTGFFSHYGKTGISTPLIY